MSCYRMKHCMLIVVSTVRASVFPAFFKGAAYFDVAAHSRTLMLMAHLAGCSIARNPTSPGPSCLPACPSWFVQPREEDSGWDLMDAYSTSQKEVEGQTLNLTWQIYETNLNLAIEKIESVTQKMANHSLHYWKMYRVQCVLKRPTLVFLALSVRKCVKKGKQYE